jgi:hypothetical protein
MQPVSNGPLIIIIIIIIIIEVKYKYRNRPAAMGLHFVKALF